MLNATSTLDSRDYGRVAVLMGGWSVEREVSLQSGAAIAAGLADRGVDAESVDVESAAHLLQLVNNWRWDHAFIAIHGRGGEDGLTQALLSLAGIPYTGSDMAASALAMDKLHTKQICVANQIDTAPWKVIENGFDNEVKAFAQAQGWPVVVKPACEGSSIGVHIAHDMDGLEAAVADACRYGVAMVEKYLAGQEIAVSILADRVLPIVGLKAANEFYDYDAKYISDETVFECPLRIDDSLTAAIEQVSMRVFTLLGAKDWGRVDFIIDAAGRPWLIEVNLIPGMTTHSLVPAAAKQAGISFDLLVDEILALSVLRERGLS